MKECLGIKLFYIFVILDDLPGEKPFILRRTIQKYFLCCLHR